MTEKRLLPRRLSRRSVLFAICFFFVFMEWLKVVKKAAAAADDDDAPPKPVKKASAKEEVCAFGLDFSSHICQRLLSNPNLLLPLLANPLLQQKSQSQSRSQSQNPKRQSSLLEATWCHAKSARNQLRTTVVFAITVEESNGYG